MGEKKTIMILLTVLYNIFYLILRYLMPRSPLTLALKDYENIFETGVVRVSEC